MGHAISAAVLTGAYAADRAASFDLNPIACKFDLTLFPLHACYCDYWEDRLEVSGDLSERPILDCQVVHHIMHEIAAQPKFAVIETDYFGGAGDQAAVVYSGRQRIMDPQIAPQGPINKALRLLGAHRTRLRDEFDTIGLGRFRDFDELFAKYDPR